MSDAAITVENLSRRFGDFVAVDRVSFEVGRGEIFGYLGANGAGKSTTIRMLCGLLAPSDGDAVVAGRRIARDPEGVKASIGYMSQKFSLYMDLTVGENVEFFGGAYGLSSREVRQRGDEVLGRVGLASSRDALTASLPGGIRQRLALGCALLHRPRIVFLDEPTAGVDPRARREFWSLIREVARSGITVFVTTHYMDEAEYCARIGMMVAGKLVALDTPAALKKQWVPGDLFAVRGASLERGIDALRTRPEVLALQPFGAGWHVRAVAGALGLDAVRDAFAGNGARDLVVDPAEATLEDVFLAAVERGAASPPPGGAP
ncbi:MAG: ABC transporter ATP-binding protein [Polyangiales bacterium]